MRHLTGPLVMMLAVALVPACGGSGGGGGSGPSQEQQTAVLSANAAGNTTNQSVTASTEAIVDSGSSGATQSTASSGSSINYSGSLDLVIDLDAPNASGNDRYPNATGLIHVVASGVITGSSGSGSANYDVMVEATTDCVFNNPYQGTSGTIYAGSTFNYTLDITWSWTDADNWTISVTTDTSLTNFSASCTSGSVTHSATINGSRDVTATFSSTAGTWSGSWSITSYWTIVTPAHTVVINAVNINTIYITIDGITFGPYTAAELLWWFHCWCI
jgi:hypothetical protein